LAFSSLRVIAIAVGSVVALSLGASPALAGVWVAGDLHVHTTYSHDSYGGPGDDNTGLDDANTYGLTVADEFRLASTRGLDYLAITDHNDIRSQTDPGFGSEGVIAVPGYENSLKTHAQMLGATRLYDNGDKGLEATRAVAAALRADGGVFQVNHPSSPDWAYGHDVTAETSEVWNLPWYYQPPFPAAADNDRALAFWQGWLDTGAKVGVTGGSDSHWAATASVQGVGQPTTWVYANEATPAGILAGLRGGHTFISHQPPAYSGPQTFLEADGDGDGTYEAMVGDTVAPGSPLRVRVLGAPGGFLRVVTDGGREAFDPVEVDSSDFEHSFVAPAPATWVHAQLYGEDQPTGRQAGCTALPSDDLSGSFTYCTNRVVMLGLTSAIFLRGPAAVGPEGETPRPCLQGRPIIGRRNIGRLRLGFTRARLLRLPVRAPTRTRRSFRYCVKGSRAYTAAVFSSRARRARVKLLVTTVRGNGNRRARVGSRAARFRRMYRHEVRVARGLYRSGRRSTRIFGLSRGRVSFIAVADPAVARDRKELQRYVHLSRQR
jgi:hypothetical protein